MLSVGFYLGVFILLGCGLYALFRYCLSFFLSKLVQFLQRFMQISSYDKSDHLSLLFRSYYQKERENQEKLLKLLLENQSVKFKNDVLFYKGKPLKKELFFTLKDRFIF